MSSDITLYQRTQKIIVDVPSHIVRLVSTETTVVGMPIFTNYGALVASWPLAPEGSLAVTADTLLTWQMVGGVWNLDKGAVPLFAD